MKIAVLQENFKRGLAIVGRAVAGKPTLPVLANVLLRADDSGLTLAATNLEIGTTHRIGAQVAVHGGTALPYKLLSDVVSNLPNDRVTLTLDTRTQTVKVECGRFTSNIKGIEADEFPTIPTLPESAEGARVPLDALREAINAVAFAAARDDSRPVLAGVLTRLGGGALALSAADGFRLATRTMALESDGSAIACIIPARALAELPHMFSGDEPVLVVLAPGGSQILFRAETTELVSRLIDGNFPDVERVIPQQYATRTVVGVAELAKAVKMASCFAVASNNVLKLSMKPDGGMAISANAAEVGDNVSEIDAAVDGAGGVIALNASYLAEYLASVVKAPQIAIETQAPTAPAVFKPVGADGNIHVIMPMNIR